MRAALLPSLILIATVLQGCRPDAVTAPPLRPVADRVADPKGPSKRIKGRCNVTFQVQPVAFGPTGQVTEAVLPLTGTCHLSYLGRSSVSGDPTVTLSPEGNASVHGTLVFTAANRSELHAAASATGDVPPGGGATYAGTLQFTGGTGRFAAQGGSVTVTGTADLTELTGAFAIDGVTAVR